MRLYDIIKACDSFSEIKAAFLSLYPGQGHKLSEYSRIFFELHNLSAVSPSIYLDAYEYIRVHLDTASHSFSVSKHYISHDSTQDCPCSIESHEALRTTPWTFVLGLDIRYEVDGVSIPSSEITEEDKNYICAAILYEITWLGFTEGAIRKIQESDLNPAFHA